MKYEGQNQTASHKRDFWFNCKELWRLWFMCRVYTAPWHHLSGIHFSAGSCWGDCYFAQRKDYRGFPNPFSPINYSNLTEPHYAWNCFFQLREWSSVCVSIYTRGCLHSPRVVQCWVIGGWAPVTAFQVCVSEDSEEFLSIFFVFDVLWQASVIYKGKILDNVSNTSMCTDNLMKKNSNLKPLSFLPQNLNQLIVIMDWCSYVKRHN